MLGGEAYQLDEVFRSGSRSVSRRECNCRFGAVYVCAHTARTCIQKQVTKRIVRNSTRHEMAARPRPRSGSMQARKAGMKEGKQEGKERKE